jgi:hypothetical protein
MIKIRLINQELDLEAEIIIQVVMIIEQQDSIMMIISQDHVIIRKILIKIQIDQKKKNEKDRLKGKINYLIKIIFIYSIFYKII